MLTLGSDIVGRTEGCIFSLVIATPKLTLNESTLVEMASTSHSFEMGLQKFDDTNLNFWKERSQDDIIVKGQIDPIENENALEYYKPIEIQSQHGRIGRII